MKNFRIGLVLILTVLASQLSAGTLQTWTFTNSLVGNTEAQNFALRAAAANTALANKATSIGGVLQDKETFEGYTASNSTNLLNAITPTSQGTYTELKTGIGTFSISSGNTQSKKAANNKSAGLTILDSSKTPFSGRYNTSAGVGDKNWLDSNDNSKIGLLVQPPLNNLYFMITDQGDVGGRLTIYTNQGANITLDDTTFGTSNVNGRVHLLFWQGNVGETISSIDFVNSSNGDGFGLDRFGTIVPEPGFYGVLAAGFAGLAVAIRRRKQSA